MINGNISKNKVIDIAILAYTLAFFLKRTVLKCSHTPNGRILPRNVFLEIASYSVMLLGDEAVVKIFKKLLWRSEESTLRLLLDHINSTFFAFCSA